MYKKKIILNITLIFVFAFVLFCVGYCFDFFIAQNKIYKNALAQGVVTSMKGFWHSYASYYVLCIISIILLSALIIFFTYLLIKEIIKKRSEK